MESPESSVISPSVKIPHVKALGQSEPGAEVLGVVHRDEQDVGLDVLRTVLGKAGEELWVTRRLDTRIKNFCLRQLKLQLLLIRVRVKTVHIEQLDVPDRVKGPFLEVDVVEVRVHVES